MFIELCPGGFILYRERDSGMWSVLYATHVPVLLPVCPYHKADGFGCRSIPVPVSVEGFAGTGVFVLLWVGVNFNTGITFSRYSTRNMMLVRVRHGQARKWPRHPLRSKCVDNSRDVDNGCLACVEPFFSHGSCR